VVSMVLWNLLRGSNFDFSPPRWRPLRGLTLGWTMCNAFGVELRVQGFWRRFLHERVCALSPTPSSHHGTKASAAPCGLTPTFVTDAFLHPSSVSQKLVFVSVH
jgi:hypothetical protein